MSTTAPQTSGAATDIEEFVTDLDGGQFARKLSIAVSRCAAAAVDKDKTAEVVIKLKFQKIQGTQQVHCHHGLKFVHPTEDGKSSEEETRVTSLHVGKFGRLSLAPENQMSFLDRQGNHTTPSAPGA